MFKTLWVKIFGNKKSRLRKQINKRRQEAVQLQRDGNIRKFSVVMTEIDELEKQHDRL